MQMPGTNENLAPVAVFAYNRPDHLQRTLDALALNRLAAASDLYIFADGARAGADSATRDAIASVRQIADKEKRFRSITRRYAPHNQGLAASVIAGVSEVVNLFGTAIVLEDDLVTSDTFLDFMNGALKLYLHEESVACISGYIYPVKETLPDTFFLKGADCWGWATWKRGWNLFESDGSLLLKQLLDHGLSSDFNFDDSFPYLKMLEDQIAGKNSSWAIRWYASAYLKNKLTLYPAHSFVQNIGFDGSGTHSGKRNSGYGDSLTNEFRLEAVPVVENEQAKKAVADYFREMKKKNLGRRVRHIVSKLLSRFRN